MDEIYLIFIAIIILILVVAVVVWAYRTIHSSETLEEKAPPPENGPIAGSPQIVTTKPARKGATPICHPELTQEQFRPPQGNLSTERTSEKFYPEIDLTSDSLSIMESLNRLCQKFGIETCTLASTDGLVIASSFVGGTRDAAYFSNLYLREKITRQGDITISPLRYKNQNLILIIRAQRNLDSEDIEAIKSYEKEILSFWL